jgi:MFS transporter, ACDE family, multidrug resistance protein
LRETGGYPFFYLYIVRENYTRTIIFLSKVQYPIIGGLLATLGWYYPFFLPIFAIPIGLLVLFVLKNSEPQGQRNLREYLQNAVKALKNRKLAGLFIGSAANFVLLYGAYITYLPQLINDTFAAPPAIIGFILSSVSIAIVITSSQLGRLTKKFHTTTLIRASFVLYAFALLTVPLIPPLRASVWLLLIPTTIFGIAIGIGAPSIQTRLTEIAPKQYLATILAVNGTFFSLGQTLGPLLMLVAFSLGGINSVFYAGVGFAILTLVVFRYCTCL